jgi:acyl-CoA reductase-like NAD-dependent aldehyde dehydrogenase
MIPFSYIVTGIGLLTAVFRAVHINGMTVHDEAVLPHGGWKSSGFGRFGGTSGFDEFLQTKTVTWTQ